MAMTGASGAPYALRLLAHLEALGVGVDLLVSPAAVAVLKQEVDPNRSWTIDGRAHPDDFKLKSDHVRTFRLDDYSAGCASGTALRRGMVIMPCSGGTLGRLASGVSSNLIERAADVCLKERRRLVLCPREAPLSLIHLRNMAALTEAGAVVSPLSPGFYNHPKSIDDLLDHIVGKVLDLFEIDHKIGKRWGSDR